MSEEETMVSTEPELVPTAINPDTWPEQTGTVTDPEILAAHGLKPPETPEVSRGAEAQEDDDDQGPIPDGAEWFQCLSRGLPTKHRFWANEHLQDPPQQIACYYCGSPTVVRLEGYIPPAIMRSEGDAVLSRLRNPLGSS